MPLVSRTMSGRNSSRKSPSCPGDAARLIPSLVCFDPLNAPAREGFFFFYLT